MTRKVTLLVLALLTVHLVSLAQNCGFDIKRQQMLANDPTYASKEAEFEAKWANYASSTTPGVAGLKIKTTATDSIYEIPVVVHVIHTGGAVGTALNPSSADIISYIDYLNQSFEATWSGYPSASSGGARVRMKFVLAKRDTSCQPTTGITRYDGSATMPNYALGGINYLTVGGETELTVKNKDRWNPRVYYNIWIVNMIDAGTTTPCFAQPPTADVTIDGLVVLASEVTGGGNSSKFAVVHEMGHAFGLLHVFEGDGTGSTCPTNTNCNTMGDRVCDTDPVKRSNYSCVTSGTNPCTSTGYNGVTQNFMDNSSCSDRFTAGQAKRMIFTLKNTASRGTFLTSLGATAPPTTGLSSPCTVYSNNVNNNFNIGPKRIVIADPFGWAVRDTLMYVTSQGYNGDNNSVYMDYTCTHRVTLTIGRTYSLVVATELPPATTSSAKAKVWIDYNNDGAFTSNERIMNSGTGTTKFETFTVPATAVKCVPIRMRVVADAAAPGSPAFDACGALDYGQAEDYTVWIAGVGLPVTATLAINNPPIGGNPSCFNTTLKFYAVHNTGITVTGTKWLKNNVAIPGATTDTLTTNTTTINPANNDIIKARIFFVTPCGIDSVTSNSDTIKRASVVPPVVGISLTAGAIPGCVDDTLTFTVTSTVNPGGAPTFTWQRDIGSGFVTIPSANAIISGGGTVLKTFGNPTGAVIRVQMLSSSSCASPTTVTSNTFPISYSIKPPTVSIALTVGTNPGCAGLPVTITATPVAGGTTPTYVWFVNGVVESGATSASLTKIFNNGDQVHAVLTSNSPCASTPNATSNTITIIQQQIVADVDIDITSPSPICDGHNIQFTATTINGGTNPNPTYQWKVNGINAGAPQGPAVNLIVKNGDQVSAILIAGDPCVSNPSDTSDTVTVLAEPSLIPSISVKLTKGKNPGCLDSLVEFTADIVDLGNTPDVNWYVNGFPAATGKIFSSASLLDGDIVKVRANKEASDHQCYLPDTVYAKPDTMVRSITLDPPIIHLIGNMIVTDRLGTFGWFTPSGLDTFKTAPQYSPGQVGPYYAVTDNRGCWSRPSNILIITLLDINTIDLTNAVKIYPNPTSGELNLDWHGNMTTADIMIYSQSGQNVLTDRVNGASQKTINLNGLADGNYFLVIKDDHNKSGTAKITVHK